MRRTRCSVRTGLTSWPRSWRVAVSLLLRATTQDHLLIACSDANEDADHVFLMFSATFPAPARVLSREYMAQDHVRITVGRPGSAHRNIHQDVVFVDGHQKQSAVYDLLLSSEPSRTLIFCNSRHQVDLLDDFLYNRRLPTTSIHSDRNQREREGAL